MDAFQPSTTANPASSVIVTPPSTSSLPSLEPKPAVTPPLTTSQPEPILPTPEPSFNLDRLEQGRAKKRRKTILSAVVVLILVGVTIIGASQIQVVREFFSRASGEPANLIVDTQAVLGPMPRPWRHLAQGGESDKWRIQPINAQVKALNPEYIRIDHIYDFYEIVKGEPGNLTFDFSKFDVILDDIAATGAKPYIALTYMPPAIAEGDIVSKPKRWEDWQLVIQKTIEHVSGTRKTADVYYEVWNEPDLFGGWKYYGDKSYLTLYSYAARGAANARGVQPFKFGGPGITALYKNWFDALAKHAVANNLRLDFFSWHRYNHDIEQYRKDMTEARQWLQAYPQLEPTLELHITEWGHDSNNHSGYDANYGAAHTVAGAIEMVGVVDQAYVFEIQDGKDAEGKEYWGRWGLFTHPDVGAKPKPRYHALRMLDKIGNQRLQLLGKGSWVKALAARDDNGNTEVVIANFDQRASHSETVPLTFTNITPGSYEVTTEFLGGRSQKTKVATDAAALQVSIPMTVNSVAFVELVPAAP
jgi:beta-xylosidase